MNPHIVTFIESIETEEHLFFVMEYVAILFDSLSLAQIH